MDHPTPGVMEALHSRLWLAAVVVLLVGLTAGCGENGVVEKEQAAQAFVLDQIEERDTLVAVTGYNPVSYFLYRGQPMGYEYELLQRFTDSLGVELEIKLENDVQKMFDMVNNGEADLIAYRLTVNRERATQVAFSNPLHVTRQVLVQQLPRNYDSLRAAQVNKELVSYPFELIEDTIHVAEHSEFTSRLAHLSEEMGGEIDVIEVPAEMPSEQLIKRVAEGDIDYTVARENIAQLNQAYYGNIAVRPALSVWQQVSWAARKEGADSLMQRINAWLENTRDEPQFKALYEKYFEDRVGFKERVEDDNLSGETSRVSEYDDEIQQTLEEHGLGWDWRLLASQMYQESRFKPRAESWAGAKGLMQLMPATAREFGVENVFDVTQNLSGGIKFLMWLQTYWAEKIQDPVERQKFVLASYNTGHGHVEDARRLAEKHGNDPNAWSDVVYYLLRKSKRVFYQDPVVRYGYCRGEEPVAYVAHVLDRFRHYKRLVS